MFRRVFALFACGAILSSPSFATIHDVPGDFDTVADAVADLTVAGGDTIRIAPGTYDVDVPSVDKALTFMGGDPLQETILTGAGNHRVFSNVTADVTLVGLTFLSAGSPDAIAPASYEGGAMRVDVGCQVVVDDCVFRNNKAGRGSAIMSYSPLIIRDSLFENNSNGHEFPITSIYGGAVLTWSGTDLLIEGSVFRTNRAGGGGAVAALGNAVVRDSEFDDNFGHHNGGALWISGNVGMTTALVEDCLFTNNWSSDGGAVSLGTKSNMTVRRCEFRENTGGQAGGAISAGKDGPLLIEDCTFTSNEAIGQGGGGIFIAFMTNGSTIRNCYFKQNTVPGQGFGIGGGALWLLENSSFANTYVEDCTFVENSAVRGSVGTVQGTGPGAFYPRFERCIMGYNEGALLWCTAYSPGGLPGTALVDCTLAFENTPNDAWCGLEGKDFVHLGPDDTQVFCDTSRDAICDDSVPANATCGVMGGLPTCGPCATPTEALSWGEIKSRFTAPSRAPSSKAEAMVRSKTP